MLTREGERRLFERMEMAAGDEERAWIRSLTQALPAEEQAIIVRRFGIAGHSAHSIEQLCEAMALERDEVRALMSRAMRRLRRACA